MDDHHSNYITKLKKKTMGSINYNTLCTFQSDPKMTIFFNYIYIYKSLTCSGKGHQHNITTTIHCFFDWVF